MQIFEKLNLHVSGPTLSRVVQGSSVFSICHHLSYTLLLGPRTFLPVKTYAFAFNYYCSGFTLQKEILGLTKRV